MESAPKAEGRHSRSTAQNFFYYNRQLEQRHRHDIRNVGLSIRTLAELIRHGYEKCLLEYVEHLDKVYLVCECYTQEYKDLEFLDPKNLNTQAHATVLRFPPPNDSVKRDLHEYFVARTCYLYEYEDNDQEREMRKELEQEMEEKLALRALAGPNGKIFTGVSLGGRVLDICMPLGTTKVLMGR